MHNEYVYLIVDEMQATREAAVIAWDNLSSGLVEGGFLGLGNPMSKPDPLGSTHSNRRLGSSIYRARRMENT